MVNVYNLSNIKYVTGEIQAKTTSRSKTQHIRLASEINRIRNMFFFTLFLYTFIYWIRYSHCVRFFLCIRFNIYIYICSHKLRELTKVNSEPKRHNSTQFTTNITLWPWETFSKLQFKEFSAFVSVCACERIAIAQINRIYSWTVLSEANRWNLIRADQLKRKRAHTIIQLNKEKKAVQIEKKRNIVCVCCSSEERTWKGSGGKRTVHSIWTEVFLCSKAKCHYHI